MENNEEHEDGLEINIETLDWPSNLAGVRVGNRTFMVNDGRVTFYGDPIWGIPVAQQFHGVEWDKYNWSSNG